jgi:hypothetical protein
MLHFLDAELEEWADLFEAHATLTMFFPAHL